MQTYEQTTKSIRKTLKRKRGSISAEKRPTIEKHARVQKKRTTEQRESILLSHYIEKGKKLNKGKIISAISCLREDEIAAGFISVRGIPLRSLLIELLDSDEYIAFECEQSVSPKLMELVNPQEADLVEAEKRFVCKLNQLRKEHQGKRGLHFMINVFTMVTTLSLFQEIYPDPTLEEVRLMGRWWRQNCIGINEMIGFKIFSNTFLWYLYRRKHEPKDFILPPVSVFLDHFGIKMRSVWPVIMEHEDTTAGDLQLYKKVDFDFNDRSNPILYLSIHESNLSELFRMAMRVEISVPVLLKNLRREANTNSATFNELLNLFLNKQDFDGLFVLAFLLGERRLIDRRADTQRSQHKTYISLCRWLRPRGIQGRSLHSGPLLTSPPIYQKNSAFRNFLLTKVSNAEGQLRGTFFLSWRGARIKLSRYMSEAVTHVELSRFSDVFI
ncbi:hypothetical protein PROFUN_12516 [Planoprotostelium fungivorum]|uniref:Uncharacterized protein n=1 Tax=Planoprotostelium fungivorum TaxID=1890364 RepID=A0A2P6MS21_9EUKA|nr:hypothetical protein PROFUN_12516 [Planoprotostelium fungivorum]